MIRLRNAPSLALMNGLHQCECHVNPFVPSDERVLRSYAVYCMHFVRHECIHPDSYENQSNSSIRNIRRVSILVSDRRSNKFFSNSYDKIGVFTIIRIPYYIIIINQ